MRLSTSIFLTDRTITPVRLARALEERGFAGLYIPEHTHIPVGQNSPFPLGGDIPEEYGRTLDPFAALAQAAAVTTRITLGTGVTLVAQHDPIVLAKQVATLDHLSGSRFTFGVGYGWNREEAADHGVEWATRRARVHDHLTLMRALWAPEPTAYEGEYGSVRASRAHPKPSGGAPPVLLGGGAGPKLFAAIAAHADGWFPLGDTDLTETLPPLRTAWEAAGRDPKTLRIVPFGPTPDADKLAHYTDFGIEEIVLRLPSAPEPEILRALDEYAQYL
ncbi:LLM class F420-dependent oxidoreductase [Streptomyces inusitatus]|uniref:LLM class F420-dependent oxidoreductase n=1 Tax=Streptomyces inusitatus TaxID=68221 RepID=A0A918PY69_9ACTN|nr:TIGR03619 family F420-dependent LLM class oxidoreductase [Streptomyces inusitatus]GGZ25129.1 LLM class F420-dependent oxidoreductase [Streptomyces inusitatus]